LSLSNGCYKQFKNNIHTFTTSCFATGGRRGRAKTSYLSCSTSGTGSSRTFLCKAGLGCMWCIWTRSYQFESLGSRQPGCWTLRSEVSGGCPSTHCILSKLELLKGVSLRLRWSRCPKQPPTSFTGSALCATANRLRLSTGYSKH
jgi:hypothetical protein